MPVPGTRSLPPVAALALLLAAAGGAAAADPVEVRPHRDSEAEYVAVSLQGDARGGLVAVSGTGDSSGTVAVSGTGFAFGTVAVSGTVTGWGLLVGASGTGPARGPVPLSVDGSCNGGDCYEVDPGGPANAYWLAVSGNNDATGHGVAASGADDARCSGRQGACVAASGADEAHGGVTVTGAGTSDGKHASVSVLGPARGGVAVSGADDAKGYPSVSGTGEAGSEEGFSGCETAEEAGTSAACLDPQVAPVLP